MARFKSQREKILEHMEDGFVVDPETARVEFGCNRLAARIHELRQSGHEIKSQMIYGKDENGDPTKHSEYWINLVDEEEYERRFFAT